MASSTAVATCKLDMYSRSLKATYIINKPVKLMH